MKAPFDFSDEREVVTMDLYVTMRFRCNNMVTPDAVASDFDGDLMAFMRWMLEKEHIINFENSSELVAVEEAHDDEQLPEPTA